MAWIEQVKDLVRFEPGENIIELKSEPIFRVNPKFGSEELVFDEVVQTKPVERKGTLYVRQEAIKRALKEYAKAYGNKVSGALLKCTRTGDDKQTRYTHIVIEPAPKKTATVPFAQGERITLEEAKQRVANWPKEAANFYIEQLRKDGKLIE